MPTYAQAILLKLSIIIFDALHASRILLIVYLYGEPILLEKYMSFDDIELLIQLTFEDTLIFNRKY